MGALVLEAQRTHGLKAESEGDESRHISDELKRATCPIFQFENLASNELLDSESRGIKP